MKWFALVFLVLLAAFAAPVSAAPFAQVYAAEPEEAGFPVVDSGMLYWLVPMKSKYEAHSKLVQRDLRSGLERTLYSPTSPSAQVYSVEAGSGRVAIAVKTDHSQKVLAFNAAGERTTIVSVPAKVPKSFCLRFLALGPVAEDGAIIWQRVNLVRLRTRAESGCGIYNDLQVATFTRPANSGIRTLIAAKRMDSGDYSSLLSEGHETPLIALSGRMLLYMSEGYTLTLKDLKSGAKRNFPGLFQEGAEHASLRADGALIHPNSNGAPVVRLPGSPAVTLPPLTRPSIAKFCGSRILHASNTDSEDNPANEVVLRDSGGNLIRSVYAPTDPPRGWVRFVSCDADFAAVGFTGKKQGIDVRLFDLRD